MKDTARHVIWLTKPEEMQSLNILQKAFIVACLRRELSYYSSAMEKH